MSHIQPTSIAANELGKPYRHTHHNKILQALEKLPNHSATSDMIATCVPFDKTEVSRRLTELCRDGKIYDTGKTGISAKGRKCILWKLVKEPKINTEQQTLF